MRSPSRWIVTTVAVTLTFVVVHAQDHPQKPPPAGASPAESPTDDVEFLPLKENELLDSPARTRQLQDSRQLSIRTVSLAHEWLLFDVFDSIPNGELHYGGPLQRTSSRGQRLLPTQADNCLNWEVIVGSKVLFRFRLSRRWTEDTLAIKDIEGESVGVAVTWINQGRTIDDPLPELDNRSIRALITQATD